MKTILLLSLFIFSTAYGATCTTTSRTNYSVGQVLTSSALNADLNQLVTKSNSLDGGCVTDGTLEAAALSATDFAAVTNGIHQGCAVSYSDANTVSVDKCILSVNGNFVKTATASTVTWGCTSCASEVVSTQYYIYAKTGSTGAALNLLISTTAPNGDGYDNSSNKVLGRFYNNSSSAIEKYSVYSWSDNGFTRHNGKVSAPGMSVPYDSFVFNFSNGFGSPCTAATCVVDQMGEASSSVSSVTRASTGEYPVVFPKFYAKIKCTGVIVVTDGFVNMPGAMDIISTGNTNTVTVWTKATATVGAFSYGIVADGTGSIRCDGY